MLNNHKASNFTRHIIILTEMHHDAERTSGRSRILESDQNYDSPEPKT
jgi:hypothetical protein